MSRQEFAKQLKTFKISKPLQDMVNELIESGIFATEAEIYRQGIAQIYLYNFPCKEKKDAKK